LDTKVSIWIQKYPPKETGQLLFHNVLDQVFATWSHVAVLRVLQDSALGMTGREIARLAGMNHRSCLKALSTLEQLSIVQRQRGGRDHRFLLNRNHLLVQKGILPLLRLERSFLQALATVLKASIGGSAQSIILFGSVARKEEEVTSDLDVCIIVRKEDDVDAMQSEVHGLAPSIQKKFGARLAPLIMTSTEFTRRAKARRPPVSSIMKDGIVVSGQSLRELARG
jgi:predicted nucleotidyltransferase